MTTPIKNIDKGKIYQEINSEIFESSTPENIESIKDRLGKLLNRERKQRKQFEQSKLSNILTNDEKSISKENFSRIKQSDMQSPIDLSISSIKDRKNDRFNLNASVNSPFIHDTSSYSKVEKIRAVSNIINDSDYIDPVIIKNSSDYIHSICKSIDSCDNIQRIIEITKEISSQFSFFGLSGIQVWFHEKFESLWSMRNDGIKVSLSESKYDEFITLTSLENELGAMTAILPVNIAWNITKEIYLSLKISPEKLWDSWKSFRLFNINSNNIRGIIIVADLSHSSDPMGMRNQLCNLYLSKLSIAISMKLNKLNEQMNFENLNNLYRSSKLRSEYLSSLSKVSNQLHNSKNVFDISYVIAQANIDVMGFEESFCLMSINYDETDNEFLIIPNSRDKEMMPLKLKSTPLFGHLPSGLLNPTIHSFKKSDLISPPKSLNDSPSNQESQYLIIKAFTQNNVLGNLIGDIYYIVELSPIQSIDSCLDSIKEIAKMAHDSYINCINMTNQEIKSKSQSVPGLFMQSLSSRDSIRKESYSSFNTVSKTLNSSNFLELFDGVKAYIFLPESFFPSISSELFNKGDENNSNLGLLKESSSSSSSSIEWFNFQTGSKNWLKDFSSNRSVLITKSGHDTTFNISLDSNYAYHEINNSENIFENILNSLGHQNESAIFSPIKFESKLNCKSTGVFLLIGKFFGQSFFEKLPYDLNLNFRIEKVKLIHRTSVLSSIEQAMEMALKSHAYADSIRVVKSNDRMITMLHRKLFYNKYFKTWRDKYNLHNQVSRVSFEYFRVIQEIYKTYSNSGKLNIQFITSLGSLLFKDQHVTFCTDTKDISKLDNSIQKYQNNHSIYISCTNEQNQSKQTTLYGFLFSGSDTISCGHFLISLHGDISTRTQKAKVDTLERICSLLSQMQQTIQIKPLINLFKSILPISKVDCLSSKRNVITSFLKHIEKNHNLDIALFRTNEAESSVYLSKDFDQSTYIDINIDNHVSKFIPSESNSLISSVYSGENMKHGEIILQTKPETLINDLTLDLLQYVTFFLFNSIKNNEINKDLEGNLLKEREEKQVEMATAGSIRMKLSSSLSLMVLSIHINDARSLQEISIVVQAKLPLVVGCKKTVLLIPSKTKNQDSSNIIFRTINSNSDEASNQDDYFEASSAQIDKISPFGSEAMEKLSKIILFKPGTNVPIGIILCFDPEDACISWIGLSDILSSALSSFVFNSITKCELFETMAAVKASLVQLDFIQKENLNLKQFVEEKDNLISEKIKDIQELKDAKFEYQSKYDKLLLLINSFSLDSFIKNSSLLSWLESISRDMNVSYYVIKRNSSKLYIENFESRDILAAAEEAISAGKCLDIKSSFDNNGTQTSVLIIPNIHIQSYSKSDFACFAFFKTNSTEFNINEKNFFTCAVNMCNKFAAISDTVPFTLEDYQSQENQISNLSNFSSRLKKMFPVISNINDAKSSSSVSNILINEFPSALQRKDNDYCKFNISLYLTSISYKDLHLSDNSLKFQDLVNYLRLNSTNDITNLKMMLKDLKTVLNGNKIFCPVLNNSNTILGIIFLERKIEPSNNKINNTVVEDILFDEHYVFLVDMVSKAVAISLENVRTYQGAYEGVVQAGAAIQTLKDKIHVLEDSSSMQLAHKLQLEEMIRSGVDLLSLAQSNRVSIDYFLETTKSFAQSIVSSENCILLVSYSKELFGYSSELQSDKFFEENSFYLFDAENFTPKKILFESSDIEFISLTNSNIYCTPGYDHRQSWLTRYLKENKQGNVPFYSIITPVNFGLNSSALFICIRKSSCFSDNDKNCMRWFSNHLSTSLKIISMSSKASKHDQSVKEAKSYEEKCELYDNFQTLLESDFQLSNIATPPDSIITEEIAAHAKNIFKSYLISIFKLEESNNLSSNLEINNPTIPNNSTGPIFMWHNTLKFYSYEYSEYNKIVLNFELTKSVGLFFSFDYSYPINSDILKLKFSVLLNLFYSKFSSEISIQSLSLSLKDLKTRSNNQDNNILKIYNLVNNYSHYLENVDENTSYNDILSSLSSGLRVAFGLDVLICYCDTKATKEEPPEYKWIPDCQYASSWKAHESTSTSINPIEIAHSTRKNVFIGSNEFGHGVNYCGFENNFLCIQDTSLFEESTIILSVTLTSSSSITLIFSPLKSDMKSEGQDSDLKEPILLSKSAILFQFLLNVIFKSFKKQRENIFNRKVKNIAKILSIKRIFLQKIAFDNLKKNNYMGTKFDLQKISSDLNILLNNNAYLENQVLDYFDAIFSVHSTTNTIKIGLIETWVVLCKGITSTFLKYKLKTKHSLVILGRNNDLISIDSDGYQTMFAERVHSCKEISDNSIKIARDILLDTQSGDLKKQKIFLLNSTDKDNLIEIWLVPIRTESKALGVIEVQFFKEEGKFHDENHISNMQSFLTIQSQLFSPVIYSVIQFDRYKAKFETWEKFKENQTKLLEDLSVSKNNEALLGKVIDSLTAYDYLLDSSRIANNLEITKQVLNETFNSIVTAISCSVGLKINIVSPNDTIKYSHDSYEFIEEIYDKSSNTELLCTLVFIKDLNYNEPNGSMPQYILKLVAKSVGSIYRRLCNSDNIIFYVQSLSSSLKNSESERSELNIQIENNNFEISVLKSSAKVNKSILDITNDCLDLNFIPSDSLDNFNAIESLLSSICVKFPTLFSGQSTISFALPISSAEISNNQKLEGNNNNNENNNILWVHSSKGNFANVHFPKNMNANSDIIDICVNLAKTCFMKKVKSTLTLNSSSFTFEEPNQNGLNVNLAEVQIINYPLMDLSGSVLAVMQLIVKHPVDSMEIDNLCKDVCKAVSRSLYCYNQTNLHQARIAKLNTDNQIISNQIDFLIKENDQWKFRSLGLFKIIKQIFILLTDKEDNTKDIYSILNNNQINAYLADMNIALVKSENSYHLHENANPLSITFSLEYAQNKFLRIISNCKTSRDTQPDSPTYLATNEMAEIFHLLSKYLSLNSDCLKSLNEKFFRLDREIVIKNEECESASSENKILKENLSQNNREIIELKSSISECIKVNLTSGIKEIMNMFLESSNDLLKMSDSNNINVKTNVDIESVLVDFLKIADKVTAASLRTLGKFDFQVSLVSKSSGLGSNNSTYRVFDLSLNKPCTPTLKNQIKDQRNGKSIKSVLETHFTNKNVGEFTVSSLENIQLDNDLIGLTDKNISLLRDKIENGSDSNNFSMISVTLANIPVHSVIVLRVIVENQHQSLNGNIIDLILSQTVLLASVGDKFLQFIHSEVNKTQSLITLTKTATLANEKSNHLQSQLEKNRKVHKVVIREMCSLMDAPSVELDEGHRNLHPASLNPTIASYDISLKILSLIRTLLRSEGQAIVLRDPQSADETYRVLYTGNSLRWTGIEQGVFGFISSNNNQVVDGISSVLQEVLLSNKSLHISNINNDTRYRPSVDGICPSETPYLAIPLRGRSGGVFGAIVAVRGFKGSLFNIDDVMAAEMSVAFSSISLYWCHGMIGLHDKVVSTLNKMQSLEESIKKSSIKSKSSIYKVSNS